MRSFRAHLFWLSSQIRRGGVCFYSDFISSDRTQKAAFWLGVYCCCVCITRLNIMISYLSVGGLSGLIDSVLFGFAMFESVGAWFGSISLLLPNGVSRSFTGWSLPHGCTFSWDRFCRSSCCPHKCLCRSRSLCKGRKLVFEAHLVHLGLRVHRPILLHSGP